MRSLFTPVIHRAIGIASLVLASSTALAQDVVVATPAERALLERVMRAEDARAVLPADLSTLREGVRASNEAIRAIAVRGLGRLERATVLADITPSLSDPSPRVRIAAADAIAQAVSRGDAAAAAAARAPMVARLSDERDAAVRAMLAESIGRLVPGTREQAEQTANTLGGIIGNSAGQAELRGGVRGLYFHARGRGAIPATVVQRLGSLTTYRRDTGRPRANDTSQYIRMVATAALVAAAGVDPALFTSVGPILMAALDDPSELVRERAVAALGAMTDTAATRQPTMRMLADPAAIVRFRALNVYHRRFRVANGCGPAIAAARDPIPAVALTAIDLLAQCREPGAIAILDSIVAAHARGAVGGSSWHPGAHALVSLATIAPDRARSSVPRFAADANFFVRSYAARGARIVRDTMTLIRLSRDRDPNVVAAAIGGASPVLAHSGDSLYVGALESNDNEVLMAASAALEGTRDPRAVPALLAALDRVTRLERETSRDGRMAVLARIRELGSVAHADRLRPYLTDFDPSVAGRAADILEAWTGSRPRVSPRSPPPVVLPSAIELTRLATTRVMMEMEDGGAIELRLFPFVAPTNVGRFVRLARGGYFNGLTLHRVAPFFVVQGGSPNANEHSGDGPFTRDELGGGVENARGTVGLSTRGRDTGDGQLYFNLIDNLQLDHNYTVYAEVVTGMEVVDRTQEGARIRRIVVR